MEDTINALVGWTFLLVGWSLMGYAFYADHKLRKRVLVTAWRVDPAVRLEYFGDRAYLESVLRSPKFKRLYKVYWRAAVRRCLCIFLIAILWFFVGGAVVGFVFRNLLT